METTKRYLENVYPTKDSQFLGSMLVSHGVMLEKQLRLYGFTALLQSHLAANWLDKHQFCGESSLPRNIGLGLSEND